MPVANDGGVEPFIGGTDPESDDSGSSSDDEEYFPEEDSPNSETSSDSGTDDDDNTQPGGPDTHMLTFGGELRVPAVPK